MTSTRKMKKKTSAPAKSKTSASTSKASVASTESPKRPRLYVRLKRAIQEMHDIARGDALPARVWELTPDGKGGFSRRQVDPKEFGASLRKKLRALDPANEATAAESNSDCRSRTSRRCSESALEHSKAGSRAGGSRTVLRESCSASPRRTLRPCSKPRACLLSMT